MIFSKTKKAQGTIEYLVILAVVVVISLVVVGLFITVFSSPSQQITDSSSQIGNVATGGISIVEAVIDYDGDSLIRISNNSSDAITLTKITICGVDNNFSEQLVGLDSKVFSLSTLNSGCSCVSGQKNVKSEIKIISTTANGNPQIDYKTINAQCVTKSNPGNPITVVNPLVSITNCFDSGVSPIPICTLTDLNRIREDLTASYILMNDIDASETSTWNSGAGWEPVGVGYCINSQCTSPDYPWWCGDKEICEEEIYGASEWIEFPFTGILDGAGYNISNLQINDSPENRNLGFIAYSYNATIQNINLVDINVGCYYKNAGLVNFQYGGTISNSSVTGNFFNTGLTANNIGGLVNSSTGIIEDSYAVVNMNFENCAWVGGLVNNASGTINNSYSLGNITCELGQNMGGLVATLEEGAIINNSHSSLNIFSPAGLEDFGGLVGKSNGIISESYAIGDVIGGDLFVGGLVGSTGGQINNSYAAGNVSGTYYIGGLVGYLTGAIENSFSIGEVSGETDIGGLVGFVNWDAEEISNSFWDINSSTLQTSAGGTGKTTLELYQQATYDGWDFVTIWTARDNNYPILSWQN